MDVFKALADKNRRELLDRLRHNDGATLQTLCENLQMSRQAVSKHLTILESCNLVVCLMRGRSKHHYLNPVPLQNIVNRWVDGFRQHQVDALIQLQQDKQ